MRASLSSTMALCLGLCLGRQAFAAPRATRAWRSLAPEHKSRYVSPRPTIYKVLSPFCCCLKRPRGTCAFEMQSSPVPRSQ